MVMSRLFHDQQVAAGEHVRIWQGEDGSLFEHVLPTGQSITIRCRTLDEARYLMSQFVQGDPDEDFQPTFSGSSYREGEQKHEGL